MADDEPMPKRPRIAASGDGDGAAMQFRILSWNILADGLADDGFVLARQGESSVDFRERLLATTAVGRKVKAAHKEAEKLQGKFKPDSAFAKQVVMNWSDAPRCMKEDFDQQLAKEKLDLAKNIQWNTRGQQFVDEVARVDPDVVVLQECDKYAFFCNHLAKHGYTSSMHNDSQSYCALRSLRHQPGAEYSKSINDLADKGFAFAPKKDSTARKFAMKVATRCPENDDIDDDGIAVFWKKESFQATKIDMCIFDDKADVTALKVRLATVGTGQEVDILGFHLPSGAEKEERRQICLKQLHSWIHGNGVGVPVVLAADFNSDVWFEGARTCCHQIIVDEWKFHSIWQGIDRLPVSVMKMRGVASNQPSKWGELMIETIDYIATSTGTLTFEPHGDYPAMTKEQRQKVRNMDDVDSIKQYMLPSSKVPSDHRPIVAKVAL